MQLSRTEKGGKEEDGSALYSKIDNYMKQRYKKYTQGPKGNRPLVPASDLVKHT